MEIIKKLKEFEEKTDYFNPYVKLYSDESGTVWHAIGKPLFSFMSIDDLLKKIDEHIAEHE